MRLRKEDVLVTEWIGVNNDAQHCQILSFHPFFCFRSCTHSFALCSTGSQRGLVSCHVKMVPSLYLLSVIICQYQQGENEYHQQSCCRETLCAGFQQGQRRLVTLTPVTCINQPIVQSLQLHTPSTHTRERKREQDIHTLQICVIKYSQGQNITSKPLSLQKQLLN